MKLRAIKEPSLGRLMTELGRTVTQDFFSGNNKLAFEALIGRTMVFLNFKLC